VSGSRPSHLLRRGAVYSVRFRINDFHTAIIAEGDEQAVFSWIEWPSKEARDAGWEKIMADERMKPHGEMPFSGKRMIWGGFAAILDQTR
jgi:uncharacterized protein YbaA (DUF1428 family)